MEKEPKATCSGNAYLHGMKSVMKESLAYIATQVHWKFYNDPPLTVTLGSVFIKLFISIFTHGHGHRLRNLLPQYS